MSVRRPLRRRAALTAVLLVAGVSGASFAVGAAAGPPCRNDVEPGNVWNRIPLPPVREVVSLVQLDDDPCDLVAAEPNAVWVSADGGSSWRRTYETRDVQRPIARLFAESLGPRTVIVVLAPDFPADAGGRSDTGVLVSGDAGLTFRDAFVFGMAEYDVVAATGIRWGGYGSGRRWRTFLGGQLTEPRAVVPAGTGPSVFFGDVTDGGAATFTAEAGSSVLAPDRLAIDPVARKGVWANNVAARGTADRLWRSSTPSDDRYVPPGYTEAWTPVALPEGASGAVRDLTFGVRQATDGGRISALLVAGDFGVLRTEDQGASWEPVTSDRASAVRVEPSDGNVVTAIVDGVPRRGTIPGELEPIDDGLPAGCRAERLSRNEPFGAARATFVTACRSGGWFRYRFVPVPRSAVPSRSALPTLPPAFTVPTVPPQSPLPTPSFQRPSTPPGLNLLPMTDLHTISLPSTDTISGNLTFDGHTLYYTDGEAGAPTSDEDIVVHRVTAATGAVQPDLVVKLGLRPPNYAEWNQLHFDIGRNLLYVHTARGSTTKDPSGFYRSRMVAYDPATRTTSEVFMPPPDGDALFAFDPSLDQFVSMPHGGNVVRHYDRAGNRLDDGCSMELGIGTASFVATGDGGLYVQDESDQAVYRIDRQCRLVAAYGHRVFSEPLGEDEEIACDAVTFGQPVIWIRDAELKSATAYAVPFGRCHFPPGLLPRQPLPGTVPLPVAPAPQPAPQPAPGPAQQPVSEPVPQVQVLQQVQPQAQGQAQGQQQAQQQMQQQAQQQIQAGMVPNRQAQPQAAVVGVQVRQGQEQYSIIRRRRSVPQPVLGGLAALMLGAYGTVLGRQWQVARQGQG